MGRKNFSSLISHFSFISGAGFTLIELLIVIAVIGIMAVGIVTILDPMAQIQKARDAQRKSDLSQVQKALETFYQDFGKYPDSSTNTDSCGTPSPSPCPYRIKTANKSIEDWGQSWQPYMSVLPKDPNSSNQYVYYSTDGQTYYLYASLDRGANDPQACKYYNATFCGSTLSNQIYSSDCGGDCNYGVSSPNVSP